MTDQWAEILRDIQQSAERLRNLIDEARALTRHFDTERHRRAMLPRVLAIRLDLDQPRPL